MPPTDERFQKMTSNQKLLMLYSYLDMPTSEELHEGYNRQYAASVSDRDEENFKNVGYTEEQIARIKKQLGDADA